ncbi:hypothetical protein BV22DRAFT_1051997 [Leucogyrophana mollusca]|uniref:Uncharacterized protein n=1 Tax=Leucogyrophana mollusca TaxID=85980 RepID=A0ACB8AWX5_9AGAM|nr:hypothetical protein BV22DRAFT_1051997 [Leucogyrophana mollusca]
MMMTTHRQDILETRGRGSGSSSKPTARGKASSSLLPNTASKPAAIPTSEKGKGPAALIPVKGKGKDIWRDLPPPSKLSKRACKWLNQEDNPALFGYITDKTNFEEECDMRGAIRVLWDEQPQAVYEDNGASSSVANPPRNTVARKGKGKAVKTPPQATEVQEDAPEVLPNESIFYGRGVQPPGWLEGEWGNQFFHFKGKENGTLVVLIGGMEYRFSGAAKLRAETTMANGAPPSLDGARQDAIPLFNNYMEWRGFLAHARDPHLHDVETTYKIKRYIAHAQQASLRTWIQAVVLEEWRAPAWFTKWREDHPPVAPSGAAA